MCGIAGFQGSFNPRLLGGMSATIAHRGPDDSGECMLGGEVGARTGFAHRRLSIIDLSKDGHQPMTVRCARCRSHALDQLALIYNGELYNFSVLRAELEAKGHTFHSRSDSEVLLHLWAESGPAMLERLNGIFAFAIRDGRPEARHFGMQPGDLLIARDQLGVKPLYYAATPHGIIFASEIKALLVEPTLSRELDLTAVHETLAYLWTPAPRTVLASVRKLSPGHALVLRDGAISRAWSYYDLPYGREQLRESEDEIARRVRVVVASAVDRQMMSDVPTGAFLSGGLDSSAVVAMMRRAAPQAPPMCYAIGFRDGQQIEGATPDLPYARRVAGHLGVPLREIEVGHEMIDGLEHMIHHLDEPQADASALHVYHISRAARADGVKVLLSGAGGDDLFSGYRRHQSLRLEALWQHLPQSARAQIAQWARKAQSEGSGLGTGSRTRRVIKLLAEIDRPANERIVRYFWWSGEALRRPLYAGDMKTASAASSAADPLLDSLAHIEHEKDALNRMLYLEAKHFLADHNLNYTDKMGMATSVEIRVPLLDLDVVDLATRIPPRFKQKGWTGKAILKRAMESVLPREVIYRPKTGFGVPLRRWLNLELRPFVDDILSADSVRRRGLFDPTAVDALIKADRAGRIDGSYTVFALACLELWCRHFLDASPTKLVEPRRPLVSAVGPG